MNGGVSVETGSETEAIADAYTGSNQTQHTTDLWFIMCGLFFEPDLLGCFDS